MIPRISKKRSERGEKYQIKRSPIKRSNPKRKKAEFARCYHSKQRVEFVKSLPCCTCRVEGFSENAHVAPPGEKGTGYKAGYEWIVPLCATYAVYRGGYARSAHLGCHKMYDRHRWIFDKRYPDFDATIESAKAESAWQEFVDLGSSKPMEK